VQSLAAKAAAPAVPEVYRPSAAEKAEKLQAQRRWEMQEGIDHKLANGLQLTLAEKQWLEDNTPADRTRVRHTTRTKAARMPSATPGS
jgi:hypothetical protein